MTKKNSKKSILSATKRNPDDELLETVSAQPEPSPENVSSRPAESPDSKILLDLYAKVNEAERRFQSKIDVFTKDVNKKIEDADKKVNSFTAHL